MKKRYLQLRRRIEDAELNNKDLAELAGIGECTLSARLNSPSSKWRGLEIENICKVLAIPRSQIGELFFPDMKEEACAK